MKVQFQSAFTGFSSIVESSLFFFVPKLVLEYFLSCCCLYCPFSILNSPYFPLFFFFLKKKR
uniref:Secreted protein n=1 Tax=Ixodes scapularis TaxID=6945 RepID=A0A1S4KYY4_IXOSC